MNKELDENYNSAVHIIKRLNYIDILKGFGILFVILGHIQQYIPSWLLIYIYSFHMPLFYYVSGYLYKEKYEKMELKGYIKKRAKELLYPYITLTIINFLWYIIKEHSINGIVKYIISFLYSNYIFDINYVGAVWFLMSLFIVEILYMMLRKKSNLNITSIMVFICFTIGILIQKIVSIKYFRLPFWIDISLFGLLFYHLGHIIKIKCNNLKFYKKVIILVLSIILNISAIILNYKYCYTDKFLGRIDMLYLHFGNYILFLLASTSGILTWQIISELICKNKLLELLGQNTLVIMGIHIIFIQILVKLFKILELTIDVYVQGGIIFIITTICSLICSLIIKKYFRKIVVL